jgi:hypothetical protein
VPIESEAYRLGLYRNHGTNPAVDGRGSNACLVDAARRKGGDFCEWNLLYKANKPIREWNKAELRQSRQLWNEPKGENMISRKE